MKKIFLVGLLIIITILCAVYFINISNKYPNKNIHFKSMQLLDYEEYTKIRPNNIKDVEIVRITVGGSDAEIIKEKEEIIKIYNMLKKKRIGRKSKLETLDNTTLYTFTLNDDTKVTIEKEAKCVVIKGERYVLK